MTTKLEQKFYDTFGIEPKHNDGCKLADNYWNNENLQKQYKTFDEYLNTNCTESDSGLCYSTCDFAYDDLKYPEITAEKLLEMICILSQSYPLNYEGWSFNTMQDLKETILEDCIETAKRLSLSSVFANKIQQLFKD